MGILLYPESVKKLVLLSETMYLSRVNFVTFQKNISSLWEFDYIQKLVIRIITQLTPTRFSLHSHSAHVNIWVIIKLTIQLPQTFTVVSLVIRPQSVKLIQRT